MYLQKYLISVFLAKICEVEEGRKWMQMLALGNNILTGEKTKVKK